MKQKNRILTTEDLKDIKSNKEKPIELSDYQEGKTKAGLKFRYKRSKTRQ